MKIVLPAPPTADEPAEPRPEPKPHISFSQTSMYTRCSMQYYYAYIRGLRQRPSLPLAIGQGGHAAIEYNSRHKIRTGDDMPMNDLLDAASTFLDQETEKLEAADLKGDDPGHAKDRAIAALRIYRHRDAPTIHPAGVEIPFDLDLNEPNQEPIRIVNGRIDLITQDAGIEDQKFAGKMKSQDDVDLTTQLDLYADVFHRLTGRYPSYVGLRVFTPGGKTTAPDVRLIKRDPALMTDEAMTARAARLRFKLRGVERGIRNGVFVPTDDPRVCSWCGFRDRCQHNLVDDYTAAQIRGDA